MLSVFCKVIKSRKCYNFMVVLAVKNLPPLRDMGLTLGLGRSPGGGDDNPLQHSCLENPLDRGAWRATVHSIAESQTQLKQLSMHAHICIYVYMCQCQSPSPPPFPLHTPVPHPWYSYILFSMSGTPFFFLYASLFCTSQNMIAGGS